MRWNFSKVRTRTGGKKNRREVRSWCYAYLFIIDIIIIIIIISAMYDVERSFAELVVDSGKTDFSHHPACAGFLHLSRFRPAKILSSDNI